MKWLLGLLALTPLASAAGNPPLRIEPRPAHALLVVKDITQPYIVVRLLRDGGPETPFTNAVVWSSSDQSVFKVTPQGAVTAVGVGTALLMVRDLHGPAQGSTTITVAAAALNSIAVSPATLTLPKGLKQQYRAIGTFADSSTMDLTDVVTWSTSNANAAVSDLFGSQGSVIARIQGTVNVIASYGSVSGQAPLMISAPIPESISIAPVAATVAVTQTFAFNGMILESDGTTQPLTGATWTSLDPGIATVDASGTATGVTAGSTMITAQFSGFTSNSATLTVALPLTLLSAASPFPAGCDGEFTGVNYENAEVETWLAIDPLDERHMVAIWQQDRWRNGGAHGLMTGVSHDGGATWTRSFAPFSRCPGGNATNGGDYERSSDPWVSIAPDGTVYESALGFNASNPIGTVLVNRSTDGGATWGKNATIIFDNDPTIVDDKDSITADPKDASYVYVTWSRDVFTDATQNTFVDAPTYFARTTDGGASWETARVIYDPVNAGSGGNEIVVLPDGTLVNFFAVLVANDTTPSNFVIIRSGDHGATWSAPITITYSQDIGVIDTKTGEPVREGGGNIAVDRNTGALYVVTMDARFSGGARNGILFTKSLDGGLSWSTPAEINQAPNVQAFAPNIAVASDGTLAVTYYDFRYDTPDISTLLTNYWQITSHDGGATWQEVGLGGPFDMRTAPFTGLDIW